MNITDKNASCQISFIAIGSRNYLPKIRQVIEIIKSYGLENDTGIISTVVIDEKS